MHTIPSTSIHPLAARLVAHTRAAGDRGVAQARAYAGLPMTWFDEVEREIGWTMAAAGQDLEACLADLDAFNALTPETENDAWYEQPRAFSSMHLDALLLGFARRRLACTHAQVVTHAPRAASLLEVGSGSGWLAGMLADSYPAAQLTLVDRSPAAVRFAAAYHEQRGNAGRVQCLRGELAAIPAPAQAFDVVIAAEVLEHAPDPAASVRELLRVLRPGGSLALSVPIDLDIAMHPTVFRTPEDILAFLERFPLTAHASELVRPDRDLDAICDVFPGFAGCFNVILEKHPQL